MAKTITKEPEGAPMPIKIRLTCPYAFYDDDGVLRAWQAGQEVIDPDEIKTLVNHDVERKDLE